MVASGHIDPGLSCNCCRSEDVVSKCRFWFLLRYRSHQKPQLQLYLLRLEWADKRSPAAVLSAIIFPFLSHTSAGSDDWGYRPPWSLALTFSIPVPEHWVSLTSLCLQAMMKMRSRRWTAPTSAADTSDHSAS